MNPREFGVDLGDPKIVELLEDSVLADALAAQEIIKDQDEIILRLPFDQHDDLVPDFDHFRRTAAQKKWILVWIRSVHSSRDIIAAVTGRPLWNSEFRKRVTGRSG